MLHPTCVNSRGAIAVGYWVEVFLKYSTTGNWQDSGNKGTEMVSRELF